MGWNFNGRQAGRSGSRPGKQREFGEKMMKNQPKSFEIRPFSIRSWLVLAKSRQIQLKSSKKHPKTRQIYQISLEYLWVSQFGFLRFWRRRLTSNPSKSGFGGRNPSPIAREVSLIGSRSGSVGGSGWLDIPNLNQYCKAFVHAHTCI